MSVLFGKRELGYTNLSDFTNFQKVNSDRIYLRYDSVYSVVRSAIDEKYQSFLAQPVYSGSDEKITWYADEWTEAPVQYSSLSGEQKIKYEKIKNDTLNHYQKCLSKLDIDDKAILDAALKFYSDDNLYCYDNKVVLAFWGMEKDADKPNPAGMIFWPIPLTGESYTIVFDCGEGAEFVYESDKKISRKAGYEIVKDDVPKLKIKPGYKFDGWTPNPIGVKVDKDFSFAAEYIKEETPKYKVRFDAGIHGLLSGNENFDIDAGTALNSYDFPTVIPNDGYEFVGWSPNESTVIDQDTVFKANYDVIPLQNYTCRFNAGEHGSLVGSGSIVKNAGESFVMSDIPTVNPQKGYKFIGWDKSPLENPVEGDCTFTAQYEKEVLPWYKRFWVWFLATGWIWLLYLLLFLLVLLLIIFLLRSCDNTDRDRDRDVIVPPTTEIVHGSKPNIIDEGNAIVENPSTGELHIDGVPDDNQTSSDNIIIEFYDGDDPVLLKQRIEILEKQISDLQKELNQCQGVNSQKHQESDNKLNDSQHYKESIL